MKTIIFATLVMTCAFNAFSQGTVLFNNRVANLATTHVYISNLGIYRTGNGSADVPPGPTDYSGCTLIGTVGGMTASSTFATLIGAPGLNAPESSMLASTTPPTTFRTGLAAGNIAPTTDSFANIPNDAAVATFEMVVWDNTSGLYPTWAQASVGIANKVIVGFPSAPFVIQNIGGVVNTSPNVVSSIPGQGLQSFANGYEVPEPTIISLAGLGAAALFIFRRRNQLHRSRSCERLLFSLHHGSCRAYSVRSQTKKQRSQGRHENNNLRHTRNNMWLQCIFPGHGAIQ